MKAVSNSKTWDHNGWTYRMRRLVDGKCFAQNLIITKYEMHARNLVARKVRMARQDLRIAILREKYPELFKLA